MTVLDEVYTFLGRFVAYPSDDARVAHAAWILHTWLMDVWSTTPRLGFFAAEKGSGKTVAMEAGKPLVPNPEFTNTSSPSAIFRMIGDGKNRPTVLHDEIDKVFDNKGGNEDLRSLYNSGHRLGATAIRCVGQNADIRVERFQTYCAVAFTGIGDCLPDDLLSRTIVIQMFRSITDLEKYRDREHAQEADTLRKAIEQWAGEVRPVIASWDAARWKRLLPEGVLGRDADNWEPLLAVGDVVGPEWYQRIAKTAATMVAEFHENSDQTTPNLCLSDLRDIFAGEAMTTKQILAKLITLEERPWGLYFRGDALTDRGLARLLKPYKIKPKQIRVGGDDQQRGYQRADFEKAWNSYLPTRRDAGTGSGQPVAPKGEPKSMREDWKALRKMSMAELERLVEEQGELSRWPHKTWGPGAELDLRKKIGNPSPRTPVEYRVEETKKPNGTTTKYIHVPEEDLRTIYG